LTNRSCPLDVLPTKGRDPLASTSAETTEMTGRPASVSAAWISVGLNRRSGAPNRRRRPVPTVAPMARARTSSIGAAVPATIRATAAMRRTSHAARRQGRLSQGATATTTAAAPAKTAGLGKAALVSQEPCRILDRTDAAWPTSRTHMSPVVATQAAKAAQARVATRRYRRVASRAVAKPATAMTLMIWTTPTSNRPAAVEGPKAVRTAAPEPISRSANAAVSITAMSSTVATPMRRSASAGWR
jgi:hypothetical protein